MRTTRTVLAGMMATLLAVGVVSTALAEHAEPEVAAARPAAPGPDEKGPGEAGPADELTMQWKPTTGVDSIGLKTATMTDVFEEANREATYGTDCKAKGAPDVRWCFQQGDNTFADWMPQGATSDADALEDEEWNGHKGMMVSWYSKDDKGIRVTLLDTETKKYRHLLLAIPTNEDDDAGNYVDDYAPTPGHAGGIVWYGHRLYVADTKWGVRVFDLDNIFDLSADPDGDVAEGDEVGHHGDTYYGYGYRYVVPQAGRWMSPQPAEGEVGECAKSGPLRNSWLSLDRAATPDRLVIGEYCAKAKKVPPGRVAMWDMKDHDIDADRGRATADEVKTLPEITKGHGTNAQGGLTTDGGEWFFSISHGENAPGELLKYADLGSDGWRKEGSKSTPPGNEDLTYRYRGGKNLVYSVTEHPGKRVIFARNTYDGW